MSTKRSVAIGTVIVAVLVSISPVSQASTSSSQTDRVANTISKVITTSVGHEAAKALPGPAGDVVKAIVVGTMNGLAAGGASGVFSSSQNSISSVVGNASRGALPSMGSQVGVSVAGGAISGALTGAMSGAASGLVSGVKDAAKTMVKNVISFLFH